MSTKQLQDGIEHQAYRGLYKGMTMSPWPTDIALEDLGSAIKMVCVELCEIDESVFQEYVEEAAHQDGNEFIKKFECFQDFIEDLRRYQENRI